MQLQCHACGEQARLHITTALCSWSFLPSFPQRSLHLLASLLHYITLHIQVIDRAGEGGAGRLGLALRGWHERYPRCFVVCMLDMVMASFLV